MGELARLIGIACNRWPALEALVGPGESVSYRTLASRAAALAQALRAQGIVPDEPVHVMVSNQPSDLVAFFGVWLAGGVVVPTHRSNPAVVSRGYFAATRARYAVDAIHGNAALVGLPRAGDVVLIANEPPPPRPLLADAALIVFTSGSTGQPKGVVLSHQAFSGKLAANDTYLAFRAGERTLLVLNITFSFGIWVSLLTLIRGGALVMAERFAPAAFASMLLAQTIDRVAVVPTMMRAWLPGAGAGRDQLDALAIADKPAQLLIGGEYLPAALGDAIVGAFPQSALIDIYGLTETSTSDFVLMPDERSGYGGCIGRPAPGVTFRLADSDGATVEPGATGELQLDTPYIMNGYLDAPDLTAAAFDGKWFRTGDMGRLRAGGVVELVGRAKEQIHRAGAKISPLEIEQVMAQHPEVAACLATGVHDPVLGERIHVFVVPRLGAAPAPDVLRAFARERLDRFKVPDAFHFGADLPLGRTGKADRGELRRRVESLTTPRPAAGS